MGTLTTKMVLIPEHLLKCLVPRGFIREVEERVGPHQNLLQSYEEVEGEMLRYFGKRMYSDYGSFRVMQNRFKRKKQTT